ncbi:MAG: type IV toxin-antitoxin system AbiEi family antitoxin domain-containing protein [Methanosarcinales archaeon]|nr:type IV toxin-antitoxin system AbiEi family antitoxin domain-containing protein [Methanosarcinales archaeon]
MVHRNILLDKLARKGSIFNFQDALNVTSLSRESLKVQLSRMEKEGWIERIEKGKYIIIPLGAEKGKYTINEFTIGSQLVKPAVIAYWSALNYHGFTEQIPNTVFIQTTSRKKHQQLEIFGVSYRIVKVAEKKFFGFETIWIDGTEVLISDPEKTVVDCLDMPHYCGGIVEVAKALHDVDLSRVIEYAKLSGNSAVLKRLGFLCDKMKIPIDISPDVLARGYPLLDPSIHGKGKANSKWNIRENIIITKS